MVSNTPSGSRGLNPIRPDPDASAKDRIAIVAISDSSHMKIDSLDSLDHLVLNQRDQLRIKFQEW